MKEMVLNLAAAQSSRNAKLNVMREYLQAYVLRILQVEKFFRSTAFVGGTALRFLYGLPRYSEDLDFSATAKAEVKFSALMQKVKRELVQGGYDIEVTLSDEKTVQNAFIKFRSLLFAAEMSPHPNQNLSIKIELDTHPPAGAQIETALYNKFFPISFLTYDAPSLMAGKVHAILTRNYTKGRDYFDLGWYLTRWKDMVPNMKLLQNALKQTKWPEDLPTEKTWKSLLLRQVKKTTWSTVEKDVQNFLERPDDLKVFNRDNIVSLLQ